MNDAIDTAASEVWIALGKARRVAQVLQQHVKVPLLGARRVPSRRVVEAEESGVSQTQHQELHGRLREQDAPGEALVDGEFENVTSRGKGHGWPRWTGGYVLITEVVRHSRMATDSAILTYLKRWRSYKIERLSSRKGDNLGSLKNPARKAERNLVPS